MKRRQAASPARIGTQKEEGRQARAVDRTQPAFNQSAGARAASGRPSLVLAKANVWRHTLILTGELNHRSAHTLEREIERLCEQGVSGITLDLRELEEIDPTGVAVIVFRSGLCKQRGYDFSLIPGPERVRRAFEEAGAGDLLPARQDELAGSLSSTAPTTTPDAPCEVPRLTDPRRVRHAAVPR
jgi:anti-anti-sigma factor